MNAMRYVSTRGRAASIGFEDALLGGLCADGGLAMPESWPQLRPYLAENRGAMGYAGAAAEVLALFAAGDVSFAGAAELTRAAYGPGRFAHPAVTPLRQIDADVWLMELFHGPSLAFKDIAMQLIAGLYGRALAGRDARLSVVCATSGDTGGAAVEALKGAERIDLFVLLPRGRVSEVQRRFMTASGADNVHAIEIDGDFDTCQAIVKALFADREFAGRANLSGVNSINWARILAQAVYYVQTAFALGRGGPVNFAVPTGNFGDAFAGLVAKRLGAPVGRILVATNANDMLARTLRTGRYARAPQSSATLSPAMDIQVASNFERLLFEAAGRDGPLVGELYGGFAGEGGFDVPAQALSQMRDLFTGVSVTDAETMAAMRAALSACGEVVCPHTAVALAAIGKGREEGSWTAAGPLVTLATAHPAKFPETVEAALGRRPALPEHAADLFDRAERIHALGSDGSAVQALIRERSRAWC